MQVGKAGDPLPPFRHHMIRQKVDRHGIISPLEPESELPGCTLPTSEIGVIKPGPVRKWMAAKKQWDTKFATAKRKVQKQRAKEMAKGYQQFGNGEVPPPSALAGRRRLGEDLKEAKKTRSMGMSLWSLWGSKHDEKTIVLEQEADKQPETTTASAADGANARALHDVKTTQGERLDASKKPAYSRSRSRRRTVTDQNQTGGDDGVDENTPVAVIASQRADHNDADLAPDFVPDQTSPQILVRSPTLEVDESGLKRPKSDGIAFPFSLKKHGATASMTTLTSSIGVRPVDEVGAPEAKESGLENNVRDVKGMEVESENSHAAVNGVHVVENGLVVSADRPPLETFVTAAEGLPLQAGDKA